MAPSGGRIDVDALLLSIARGPQRTFERRGATRRRSRRDPETDELAHASLGLRMMRAGQPVIPRREHVLAAQRVLGNQAVAQMLGHDEKVAGTERSTLTMKVRIPWGTDAAPAQAATPTSDRSRAVAAADGATSGPDAVIEHPESGEATMSIRDAIAPSLTFRSDVGDKNPKLGPDEFGLTSWSSKVVDPVVSADAPNKAFNVTATIDCPIVWEVHSRGKIDVPSAMAPITKIKWPTAASDLTPDMSDDNGRPPRTEFWANDLTVKHEKFHVDDFTKYGKAAFDLAAKWLLRQTASSADDALRLTKKVPDQMVATLVAALVPKAERRAYGDGAPSYKARAQAIAERGRAGGYGR